MRSSAVGRTWDSASSPEAARCARHFELAWRAASPDSRPDPLRFFPEDSQAHPGVRLALLRADMTLRREAGLPSSVAYYLERIPDLDDDTILGLIYEEFCLREEEFENPDPAEYLERYPALADRLRRVLEIHDLVGAGHSTAFHHAFAPPDVTMPGVGETIAGYRLVQELGRGSFARVFLAEEQALGDRSVALKVSRAASREPQALARLQHTHIVPIHSYQTDPETGLHLLCMPYFGRVTLDRLLNDPKVRKARGGAEVVSAIDRLDPAGSLISDRPAGRLAMSKRSYARALAWWCARLAEALQHAHDRGVLHRDIKPSNVLITGDGLPMLLDFNLAWEPWVFESGESAGILGGTIAYMAPEHLEALTIGDGGGIDGRADVYSLGVVLHEALDTRPFPSPMGASSLDDAVARSLDQRRNPPRLHTDRVEIPPELEIVVRKCMAADPGDRYARPGDLAEDLQAVADDAPLRHAREPILGRSIRAIRRNRRPLALAALTCLIVASGMGIYLNARKAIERDRREVRDLIDQGVKASDDRKLELAVALFGSAVNQAGSVAELAGEASEARKRLRLATQTKDRLDASDSLHNRVDDLRLRLLDFVPSENVDKAVREALGLFYVLDDRATMPERREWFELDGIALLDLDRRNRLFDDVDELLFLRALSLDARKPTSREALIEGRKLCRLGLKASANPAVSESDAGSNPVSWKALFDRFDARLRGQPAPIAANPAETVSASECYRWGLILKQVGDRAQALNWLRKAARRKPSDYWYAFYLAFTLEAAGDRENALTYYSIAIALRQSMPWAYLNRGLIYRALGAWDNALLDLRAASASGLASRGSLADVERRDFAEAQVLQDRYETVEARRLYQGLADRRGEFHRAALTNLAALDAREGQTERAMAAYDRLLTEMPTDSTARQARASLAFHLGRLSASERDLNILLQEPPVAGSLFDPRDRAEAFAIRARVRLAQGWPIGAMEDADRASSLAPGLANDRLRLLTMLAAGRVESLRPDGPEAFDLLPIAGSERKTYLRAAADRLAIPPSTPVGEEGIGPLLARSAILAALGHSDALTDANRAVSVAPGSTAARWLRAKVRARLNDREGALEDVEQALRIDPNDARGFAIRGQIRLESGDPAAALVDFDHALERGDNGPTRSARAAALAALHRPAESIDNWTRALRLDPEDPRLFLGRAHSFLALSQWDHALADLESAANFALGRADLIAAIADAYDQCLPHRPDRAARAAELKRLATSLGPR